MIRVDSNQPQGECLQSYVVTVNSRIKPEKGLKEIIVDFEQHEECFLRFNKQINHALTYPNQYDKLIFTTLLEHEQQEVQKKSTQLDSLVQIFQQLDKENSRPYRTVIQDYQAFVEEHVELIGLLENSKRYMERIHQSSQINQELLADYMQTLTWQYMVRGIVALTGAFMIHMVIGSSNRWNMLNVYATSYYKIMENPSLTIKIDVIGTPLALFFMGIGMRLGTRFNKVTGTFLCCLIAMNLSAFLLFLSSYMPNFQCKFAAYSVFMLFAFALYPLVANLAFHSVMNQVYSYYPASKIVLNGIILSGTAFGHIFFGSFDDYCINPNQQQSPYQYFGREFDYITTRLPNCIRLQSYVSFAMGLLGVAMMFPLLSYNSDRKQERSANRPRLDFEYVCATEKEAICSRVFWIFVPLIILTTCGCYFMSTNFRNLLTGHHRLSVFATVLLAFNVSNSIFRPIWTFIFSKIGFKWCMVIICSINTVLLMTLPVITDNIQIYIIYYAIGGATLGGCMVIFINFSILVFGQHIGQQLPGYVWAGYSFASFLQYIFVQLYNVEVDGYQPILYVLATFNIFSLAITLRVRFQGEWQNQMTYLELKCQP